MKEKETGSVVSSEPQASLGRILDYCQHHEAEVVGDTHRDPISHIEFVLIRNN